MTLEELLERINPNKYINELSNRKDLIWDIIQKYHALPWPAKALSRLAPLTYINQHPDKTWDYSEISKRKDLNIDFIKIHKDKLNWSFISMNIDFQDVLDNIDLPWYYETLSANKKITPDDIIENPQCEWNYSNLSKHINIDFVYANAELPWNYYALSKRVCLDFICQNLQCEWNYIMLSQNPNIMIDFVLEHQDKNWNWGDLYDNLNITLEDLITNNLQYKDFISFQRRYPDYCLEHLQNLNWEIISEYASLDVIKKYPNKPWDYNHWSFNRNITIDFVLEHPTLSWDFFELSRNPGITLQDVLNNWNFPWNIFNIITSKY